MPLVPVRLLPDADDVLRSVLSAAGVPVYMTTTPDLLDNLPAIVARRFGGASTHPALLDRATVQVDAYADTRRLASDTAETCRALLYRAWREQQPHAGASIARFFDVAAPAELRTDSQADHLFRFTATYSLLLRP